VEQPAPGVVRNGVAGCNGSNYDCDPGAEVGYCDGDMAPFVGKEFWEGEGGELLILVSIMKVLE
jgi:hypothetical protein